MAYTANKPELVPPSSVLRSTIVGWGVDLDPKDRPAVPKERFNVEGTGAHWHFPERQKPERPRERSIEHRFLTPVFGTACPTKGLSGIIRRYAYRRFSEGRSAHWLLLMLADRIDVLESGVTALLRGRPDNIFAERGLRAEFTRHGWSSRVGRGRSDVKHLPLDVLMFAGTGLLAVGAAYWLSKGVRRPVRALTRGRRDDPRLDARGDYAAA